MREKNKLLDINKKSDVSRCAIKGGAVQCAQTKRAQTNGQRSHRGSCCCRKKTGGPTAKTVKEIHPPRPPSKLPDIKLPTRPKINWPVAPDCYIPNSVVKSLAPFPPRCGAVPRVKPQVKEEKKDVFAESVMYVQRLIEKYGNIAEQEKKKHSWTFRKSVAQR